MALGQYDFANPLGDAFRRTIVWNDENGQPVPLTDCTAVMTIKSSKEHNAQVYATLTTSNDGLKISNPTGGQTDIVWESAQQSGLFFRSAYHKLVFTFPNGDEVTFIDGQYNTFTGAIEGPTGMTNATQYGSSIGITTIGIPGAPGVGSGASGGTAVAGVAISADTAVILQGGLMYPADPTNSAHAGRVVGVAAQSGAPGATIQYQESSEIPGGSWTQDTFLFVGLNGVLSTTPNAPGSVWSQKVGYAKTASVLFVELGLPVVL